MEPFEPNAVAEARALLAREARAGRGRTLIIVLLGVTLVLAGIAQAWLVAQLLAALLGAGGAGWNELYAAGALALLMAALGIAQERAQVAAADGAKARLRRLIFDRLLVLGPADERPVGERSALVV